MGLDISFASTTYEYAFRAGSYSGFGMFRDLLAAEDDIILDEMWGFGGSTEWGEVDSALEPLLNHSDCDGELYNWQAEQMIPRMEEILPLWENGHYNWDRKFPNKKLSDEDKAWYADRLRDWIKACKRIVASEDNEYLVFG